MAATAPTHEAIVQADWAPSLDDVLLNENELQFSPN